MEEDVTLVLEVEDMLVEELPHTREPVIDELLDVDIVGVEELELLFAELLTVYPSHELEGLGVELLTDG